MFDSTRREIHYLRLSVTDLCNLRCRYCMPDGVEKLEREAVLTYEEFLRLAALFAQCGIDTVRVTGGEPLVRKNVAQLVAGLKAIPGIRKVTMTTNGILLAQQLPALLAAGLDSVNISLDTLRPEVFRQITARDEFAAVQAGLQAALESGIPVKLNCVPQAGVNEGELEDLAALAENRPLQVRFIEMMPIGYGASHALHLRPGAAAAVCPPLAGAAAAGGSRLRGWPGGNTTPCPAGRAASALLRRCTASSAPAATGCG
ncbi:MAG: GTP 3',8-cyclase MoaA [Faecalibacterium sp.]